MAECSTVTKETTSSEGNYYDCENSSHPSHNHIKSSSDSKSRTKVNDTFLPNGVTRLTSDSNGMIHHGSDVFNRQPKPSSSSGCCEGCTDTVYCPDVYQTSHVLQSIQGCTEHDCDCDKSNNQNVSELTSDMKSMLIDKELQSDSEENDILMGIEYVVYKSEVQMPDIMRLITKDLSEPYSIYTYRYFIHNWPKLCFLAMDEDKCVGAIVCKLDMHKKMVRRGYIAMLAVDSEYRRKKIGSHLVLKAIKAMIRDDCDEVVLETEITNQSALRLYENLGFVRDKRLFRYYLNGVDALRLKLWLR